MLRYTIRRVLGAIPLLLVISLILFTITELAPGDPAGQLPLTIPEEVRQAYRASLGLDGGFFTRWLSWVRAIFWYEPQHAIESIGNFCIGDCIQEGDRIVSFSSRSPAIDIIYARLPRTIWVMTPALVFGILIAVPIGVYSAYRQYSAFDNVGSFVSLIGWSMPVYWSGLLLIYAFSVNLGWFPSRYDPVHEVSWTDLGSIGTQIRNIALPVTVLTFFNAAQFSRFTRASVLDNLNLDYVRTARSKGLREFLVVNRHVLRNSMLPVVTLIALSAAGIFSGAILTETVFSINGTGSLLIQAIFQADFPMLLTLTFFFAVMRVLFNIIADVLYGVLDPRIRYD
ncbi:MAG: ABC transporter permease [Actinomycetota bacterium]